jgi:glycosyltransferase involved in cell wall biosynthesis
MLKRIAQGNIEFCGRTSDAELRELYARCRAFLIPAEEDFGITAVEALASGKPVVALGRGGALETVPLSDPLGGILYDEPTDDALAQAVEAWNRFEDAIEPHALQAYAARFSPAEFARKMRAILFDQWEPRRASQSMINPNPRIQAPQ